MKVLVLSLDKTLFQGASDASKRLVAYAGLAEQTFVIVFNRGQKLEPVKFSENLFIYPTNSKSKFCYFFDAILLAKKIKKQFGFNLISAQDPYLTGLIALVIAKFYKVKLLLSIFGTDIFNAYWLKESRIRYLLKLIGLITLKSANAIQTDNPESADVLRKKYGAKVFWKPLVPSAIEDYRLVQKTSAEFFRILTVVRLVKQKNLPMLVNIIDGLFKSSFGSRVKFTLVGNGAEEKYIQDEFLKRGLIDKVEWIKGCDWQELIKYYTRADLFILTSFYEGFPRVFQEAMAVGLPIITTPVANGLVKDGFNGFVVEHNNAVAFLDKIQLLISDPIKLKEFGENGRKYFWENFSFETTLKIQKKIYNYLEN